MKQVLQLCHGYDGPFLDCARQYAALFAGTSYRVTTVYLTGVPDENVVKGSSSDRVIFLNIPNARLRGLKLGAIAAVRRIVSEGKFEFCIAHRAKPTYVALLATRLPVVAVQHALGNFHRWQRRLFVNFFRSRLLLIGVSDAVRDDIRADLPDWPHERIQTLYNRLDVAQVQGEQLPADAARTALGLPAQAWIVGNVGRLHPDKDQATLIAGFAQALPDLPPGCLLVIAGEGKLERELKQQAASLGIGERVRFLGQVPNARRYFRAFDVFVLSSGPESFGMVLVEAMAAGVPLIATDCGGAREVVNGVGKLFPPQSVADLAAALREQAALQGDVSACRQRMMDRLNEAFSDESARRRFWEKLLPVIYNQGEPIISQ
jgi:glycosyltransferase involved in cell wall biosynthesis